MERTTATRSLVGRSPATIGTGLLVGLVLSLPLVLLTGAVLGVVNLHPRSLVGLGIVFVAPTLLGAAVAAEGGGLVGSWVVGLPYFAAAFYELIWCYGGGMCVSSPPVTEMLPSIGVYAALSGLVGYGLVAAVAKHRHQARE